MSLVSHRLIWDFLSMSVFRREGNKGSLMPLWVCPALRGVWRLQYHYWFLAQSYEKMDIRLYMCAFMAEGRYSCNIRWHHFKDQNKVIKKVAWSNSTLTDIKEIWKIRGNLVEETAFLAPFLRTMESIWLDICSIKTCNVCIFAQSQRQAQCLVPRRFLNSYVEWLN